MRNETKKSVDEATEAAKETDNKANKIAAEIEKQVLTDCTPSAQQKKGQESIENQGSAGKKKEADETARKGLQEK